MEIKARIALRGKAKKFIVVENLPLRGSAVPNSEYIYGDYIEVDLPPVQRLADSVYHKGYDFFILPILTKDGKAIGEEYYCYPHRKRCYVTTAIYQHAIEESRKYNNKEDFITSMYNSDIWDIEDVKREGREEWIGQIWDATHRTMKDILKITNMSQIKMCRFFGIPRRTLEDWCMGVGNPPPYVLIMMQEILGLIERN